jgi:PIN domain nuclease of toxin-antitoxin system
MRLLLDTHAVLWALEDSPRLSSNARKLIEDPTNEVFVSAASAVEIAIKKSLGKLRAPDDLGNAVTDAGFAAMTIGFQEAALFESLPWHHNDPFDRLLIAQAMVAGMPIVTCDSQIGRYQVQIIW